MSDNTAVTSMRLPSVLLQPFSTVEVSHQGRVLRLHRVTAWYAERFWWPFLRMLADPPRLAVVLSLFLLLAIVELLITMEITVSLAT